MKTHTQQWLAYFTENSERTLEFEPDPHRLTREERERITSSIQAFQIGEASEGRVLREKAELHARTVGDPSYGKLILFLIREENRHSAYLGQFMREHEIPLRRSTWTDGVFRWLRNLAGLELSIRVLVTAELIAVSYYRALAQATASPKLRKICERMGEEEIEHIRFQMLTIHRSAQARSDLSRALADLAHAALMLAASVIVALEHRNVIRTRERLGPFVNGCFERFREAMDEGRMAAGARSPRWAEVRS